MSTNRELKNSVVSEIKERVQKAQSVVLVNYKGLYVEQDTTLRNKFRENGCEYKVCKNRLIKLAFDELGIKIDSNHYDGPTALATCESDVVAPARIVFDGEKEFKVVKAKCGYIEGKVMEYDAVKNIASIPSKEVLVAQLLGMLLNPIRSLAVVLDQASKKEN
jgi:large subunit ribosomal protein L10